MSRYFVRFLSQTFLAMQDRQEQQANGAKPVFSFNFPADKAEVVIYDSLEQLGSTQVHRGLRLDMYVEAISASDALSKGEAVSEHVLGLLTLSQLCPCAPVQLLLTYDASSIAEDREFKKHHVSFAGLPLIGSVRKINVDLLDTVFRAADNASARLRRSIQWLRKGLVEHHTLDEFTAYWTGLETLAPELNELHPEAVVLEYPRCPRCRKDIANCPECRSDLARNSAWKGLLAVIANLKNIDKKDFEVLRKFRGRAHTRRERFVGRKSFRVPPGTTSSGA